MITMLLATPPNLRTAVQHLATQDKVLRPIIAGAGLPTLRPHRQYYQALADSIIGQQLSIKAAASIRRRFRELFGGRFPTPEMILRKTPAELRTVGLSGAKTIYIRDLAQHIKDGQVRFDKIASQSNETIIAELNDVKGIGVWTAHMFLIFCIGRLDVLPVGDLGIKSGVQKLYGLKVLPTPDQIIEIAETYKWHPYESVASWYIWHSLDNS
jgi:DNA-3-methyladenine glycosylase II